MAAWEAYHLSIKGTFLEMLPEGADSQERQRPWTFDCGAEMSGGADAQEMAFPALYLNTLQERAFQLHALAAKGPAPCGASLPLCEELSNQIPAEAGADNWLGPNDSACKDTSSRQASTEDSLASMQMQLTPVNLSTGAMDFAKESPQKTRFRWSTASEASDDSTMDEFSMMDENTAGSSQLCQAARQLEAERPSQTSESASESASSAPQPEAVTTLMICNLPCRILQEELEELLSKTGFDGRYDWLHVPTSQRNRSNLGYAFVNVLTLEDSKRLHATLSGYRFPGLASKKVLSIKPARVQGSPLRQLAVGQ